MAQLSIDYQRIGQQLKQDWRVPIVVLTIMAIAIGITLFNGIKEMLYSPATTISNATPTLNIPVATNNLPIASLHLFGVYTTATAIPPTLLQLTLEGTDVSHDSSKNSTAIIAAPGQPAMVYQIGDRLPGGAVLYQVHEDYILIKRNDALESLQLPLPLPKR